MVVKSMGIDFCNLSHSGLAPEIIIIISCTVEKEIFLVYLSVPRYQRRRGCKPFQKKARAFIHEKKTPD